MSDRTEQTVSEDDEKRAVYERLQEIRRELPEIAEYFATVGATYGWKFAGRALAGRTFEQSTGGK